MDLEDISRADRNVIVLEDQSAAGALGKLPLERARPSLTGGGPIAVGSTNVHDHDGLRSELHAIEHLGLTLNVVYALRGQLFIRAVEDDVCDGWNESRRCCKRAMTPSSFNSRAHSTI